MLLDEKKRYSSPGVRQCLKILAWISRSPEGIGFNDLRERVFNLPASTMNRHLKILTEESWIGKNSKGLYQPGPAYLCAVSNVAGKPNPDGLIRPVLDRLARETRHSAAFAEWDRGGIRFRLKKDMPRSYCYPGAQEIVREVFTHPFGLTALAFLSQSVLEWNLETRPAEIPSMGEEKLREKLVNIKKQGIYTDIFGCRRFCAPVMYNNGDLMGVIGLSVLESDKDLSGLVKKAARDIEMLEI
jgi:DNA-binding IclR family transcriptional regulator